MGKFTIKKMPGAEDLPLPARMSEMAAGLDLRANVREDAAIKPGGRLLVPTGISVALPYGYEAQIRPRSGLALRHGVTVLNAPGTVDADYRGEICALLANFGESEYIVRRGERIAQLVLARVEMAAFELEEAGELPLSARGAGGFGSTGGKNA